MFGTWPSLVRRLTGGQEIGGSNPLVPTTSKEVDVSMSTSFSFFYGLSPKRPQLSPPTLNRSLDSGTPDIPLICSFREEWLPSRLKRLGLWLLAIFCLFQFFSLPVLADDSGSDPDTEKIMVQAYRYYTGQGLPVNYSRALKLYLIAATRGDAEAQFIVGGMLYKGMGTDPDQRQAFKWLQRAEQQGKTSPESLGLLGLMYLQGIGVPQNYVEAEKRLSKAAEQGDIPAKKYLAFMYYQGLGGSRNFAKALALYTEAGLQGDNAAQNNVGLMYVNGLGTEVNRVRGYAWYSLAASQGNVGSMIARNDLMTRMSWEELNRAQKLSVQLYEEMEKNLESTSAQGMP